MLTHHEGKGAHNRDGQDGVLGSTAIVGSVDVTFALRRDAAGRRTIQSTARYGEDLAARILLMDEAGRVTLGDTREAEDLAEARREVLKVLADQAEPILEKGDDGLRALVTGRPGNVGRAIRELVAEGEVRRSGAGRKGSPFLYTLSRSPEIQVSGSHPYTGNPKPETANPMPINNKSGFPGSETTVETDGSAEPESSERGVL